MNDWTSYRIEDFIPFTSEVYFRLLERMGETFWPLHLFTLALGAAAFSLALTDRARIACMVVAPLWAWVGIAFFIRHYAELNWAGHYIGGAFIAQAFILLVLAAIGRGVAGPPAWRNIPVLAGALIAGFGLIVHPLIAPLTGHAWHQAETYGIHPDPTAVTTLGLAMIGFRGAAIWAVAAIPLLWLTLTVLTLLVLDAAWTLALLAVLVLGLAGLVWKSTTRQSKV